MKLIFASLPLLLLASCTQYRYDVTYEKCNGQTGEISFHGKEFQSPRIDTYKEAVPILRGGYQEKDILNVCDFSYTRNEIK